MKLESAFARGLNDGCERVVGDRLMVYAIRFGGSGPTHGEARFGHQGLISSLSLRQNL